MHHKLGNIGVSKMHLSPRFQVVSAAVLSKAVVLLLIHCLIFLLELNIEKSLNDISPEPLL